MKCVMQHLVCGCTDITCLQNLIFKDKKEDTWMTCCISNGAFIAMCCIPTFIDVIDLLVKASFLQGWHPHLGKKKAEGSNARGVCVLSVVEKCVCKLEQP